MTTKLKAVSTPEKLSDVKASMLKQNVKNAQEAAKNEVAKSAKKLPVSKNTPILKTKVNSVKNPASRKVMKKALSKSDFQKIVPGTWIEVQRVATENEVMLVLQKPVGYTLSAYNPATKTFASFTNHYVVGIIGSLVAPKAFSALVHGCSIAL